MQKDGQQSSSRSQLFSDTYSFHHDNCFWFGFFRTIFLQVLFWKIQKQGRERVRERKNREKKKVKVKKEKKEGKGKRKNRKKVEEEESWLAANRITDNVTIPGALAKCIEGCLASFLFLFFFFFLSIVETSY